MHVCTGTKDDRVQWGPAMASFSKFPSGRWRAMVRKQGHTLSNTFRLKVEAETWAAEQESRIGRGEKPSTKPITRRETLGDLIDLHLEDLKELGRGIGRSKEHTLFRLTDTRWRTWNRPYFGKSGDKRAPQCPVGRMMKRVGLHPSTTGKPGGAFDALRAASDPQE